jgi:hypothetical protein
LDIKHTLAEREQTHGCFQTQAQISQELNAVMKDVGQWGKLSYDQMEAMEMIAHKIARILNGNPNFHDHWHDIAGYATLVADRLEKK